MLLGRDHDLIFQFHVPVLERRGRLIRRVKLLESGNAYVPLAGEFVPGPVEAGVESLAVLVVDRLGRGGPISRVFRDALRMDINWDVVRLLTFQFLQYSRGLSCAQVHTVHTRSGLASRAVIS